jgi:iron complex outermembrane receptor protein
MDGSAFDAQDGRRARRCQARGRKRTQDLFKFLRSLGVSVVLWGALSSVASSQESASANRRESQPPGAIGSSALHESDEPLESIEVVGSHIGGAGMTDTLPTSILVPDMIATFGVVTGHDLMRVIPQMGNVTFNASNDQQTSNAARGDVASIDLRGAGLGDTLVLLNGRRMVEYPSSQSTAGVPLISYNAQTLPMTAVQRVEVLRAGAGAIYGADAVAGVVNVVTKTDLQGVSANVQYGIAQGTHREETDANILAGQSFGEQRGNISVTLDVYHRTAQLPSDEPYTATLDLRPFFANDPGYNMSSAPDSRTNQGSFAALVARSPSGGTLLNPILQGAIPLTTAAGSFHIQPNTLAGCVVPAGNGLCFGTGTVPYATSANSIRFNANASDSVTIAPDIDRQTLSLNTHYAVRDDITVYAELDYYHADSHGLTTDPTALVPIGVPASNYYNPLAAAAFDNGTSNPNRLPGLTNVPAKGLPVSFATYRFNDLGPDNVDVASYQDRFLLGVTGYIAGFKYDSALLHGEAQVRDTSDGINSTLLAHQLALSTPNAYNPFNGGCLGGPQGQDCTPSSLQAIDAIRFRLKRVSTTALTDFDYQLSRSDFLRLPAGSIALAIGVEARRESHSDVRDPNVNGTIPFVDPVLNTVSASNATGVSTTPTTSGSRDVFSAYSELALPLVSSDMRVPMVQTLDAQVAARYEHYSDFGNVAKPKVALRWRVADGVLLRASWEQGFKAPNLETTAPFTYARADTVTDWYRCQAALNKGLIANFSACNQAFPVSYTESGNPALRPESSQSYNIGAVLRPVFIADQLGKFELTLDRWELHQVGIVGVDGSQVISVQDYLRRVQGVPGSPNLIRAAPTADDVAFYAGSGLAAVGVPTVVNDTFRNLQPQTIKGLDIGIGWSKATTELGSFEARLDAAHLDEFSQPPSPVLQALYTARAAGSINAATPLTNPGDQLEVLGNPKWKATASLTWKLRDIQGGASVNYTGPTKDINFLSNSGVPWPVASLTTLNLYGQYTLSVLGLLKNLRIRCGVRNLFNRAPPLESDGYNGALYEPYGRYLYLNFAASL